MSNEIFRVELNSPGIVFEVPNGNLTMRTPCCFHINESDIKVIETQCKIKGISNFKIYEVDKIDIESPRITKVSDLSIKKPKSSINIGGKFNQL